MYLYTAGMSRRIGEGNLFAIYMLEIRPVATTPRWNDNPVRQDPEGFCDGNNWIRRVRKCIVIVAALTQKQGTPV